MIRLILVLLLVSFTTWIFGFTGIAGAAAGAAQILFYILLAALVIAIIAGVVLMKKVT